MKKIIFLFTLLFLTACSTKSMENNKLDESSYNNNERNFQFNYNVILEPSDTMVEVWIPIPQSNEVQKISNLIFNYDIVDCNEYTEEVHGNKYYYCVASNLDTQIELSLSCDVNRMEHGFIQYSGVDPNLYDKGTLNITVPEGDIFESIISSNKLNSNNIDDIYNYVLSGMHYGKPKSATDSDQYYSGENPKTGELWMPSNIKYGYKQVDKDEVVEFYLDSKSDMSNYTFGNGNSLYACDIGVGNCTDYHSYFMSLCRTIDIPARFHMGFPIPNGDAGKVGGYHCWADYYVEGKGWAPVDISEADKDPSKKDYFFGTVCKNRVEFTTGRDLELYNHDGLVNFFVYPIIKGTDYKKSFSYKNI